MGIPEISLVIPAYNEEKIILDTINTALAFLRANFSDYELIIADDGSTDKTRALAEAVADEHLKVVSHFPNKGKGAAVRQGVLVAGGAIVAYTDADLAYGINAVGELYKLISQSGADAAIGSRKLHPEGYADYPAIRLFASRCFSFLTGLIAGFHYDTQCGLKAFSAQAAKKVFSLCETDSFAFDFEVMMIANKLKLSVVQLPAMIINHRESKVNVIKDSIKMFADVFSIRRSVTSRLRGSKDGK